MRRAFVLITCALCAVHAAPSRRGSGDDDARRRELEGLKAKLAAVQDSLDAEIAARWEKKQRYLAERETDKEETARLRDSQEHAYRELSRTKEERFARERLLEQERAAVEQNKTEWKYVVSSVDELLQKRADAVLEGFPLDLELRRLDMENIRAAFDRKRSVPAALETLVGYDLKYFRAGCALSLDNRTILTDDDRVVQASVARFGNVFAYALGGGNTLYAVRQTGRLGLERFAVERIAETAFSTKLLEAFTRWLRDGRIGGWISVDILQNAQSRILTSGESQRISGRIRDFVVSGGPVMAPLLLLPLWALVLIALKLVQFGVAGLRDKRAARAVMPSVENGDIEKASDNAQKSKGTVARVIAACLAQKNGGRECAENAVREVLSGEIPRLGRHLNTLAVIGAVAPLLGLLGTVTGMINLFKVITDYGTGDPKLMASGISEALITTETGLIIAVPILLIHNYLRNRKSRLQAEVEQQAIRTLNRLWPGSGD